MRKTIIAIFVLLSLCACDSDHERMVKIKEKYIRETIRKDWRTGIPLDALVKVSNLCRQNRNLQGCDEAHHQVADIAASYTSCYTNQRSKLCLALIRDIGAHQILSLLPESQALNLPSNPWYWELPTSSLEALSGRFEYRSEAATWWWQAWGSFILFCFALLAITCGGWFWRSERIKEKKRRAAALAYQREVLIAEEESRRIRKDKELAEATRLADLEREAAIKEQQRLKAEYLAEQQRLVAVHIAEKEAAEKAAQLTAEQAEAASLLNAISIASRPKRKKNVTSAK